MTDRFAAFAELERVVADPMRFKARLRIGDDVYLTRRFAKWAWSCWDAAGVASTGANLAKSAAVATAFFAPPAQTGVLAWLGLATPAAAVTPVGWVIAAAVVAGGGYYGVTCWWASRPDHAVDVVPRFINSPIDTLGASLFDLGAGLAYRVAAADGEIASAEHAEMAEHFIRDWGFDPAFVAAALPLVEQDIDQLRLEDVAGEMARFLQANPDCKASEMQADFISFLRDLMMADGWVDPAEQAAIMAIEQVFRDAQARWSLESVSAAARDAASMAGAVAVEAANTARAMSNQAATVVRQAVTRLPKPFE